MPRVSARPVYADEPKPLRRRLLLAAAAIGAVAAYTALKRAPGKVPAQVAEVGAPVEAVEIYTTPSCPVCAEAKAYMRRRKIRFTEYDVENDGARLKEFYERGGHGVPYILVGGQSMHGFNADAFERLRAGAG